MTTTDTRTTSWPHPTCTSWCAVEHDDPLEGCYLDNRHGGLGVNFIPAANSTTGRDAYYLFVPSNDGWEGELVDLTAHQAALVARALDAAPA